MTVESRAAPRAGLRVAYVTMAFPAGSETFAVQDVRALRQAGAEVTVHSLRPRYPGSDRMSRELAGEGVRHTHNSLRGTLAGLGRALRSPGLGVSMLLRLARATWRTPSHLARSLVLLPRALGILAELEAERPDVVHLFWGHYPSLVGELVLRRLPEAVLSVFLGAYDLEWGYGGSAGVARRADVVWTHARTNVPAILSLGVEPERVRVAHRGLDLSRIPPAAPAREPRRIVSVGRLIPSKGFDGVLDVFADLRARVPDATLVICGDGPDRPRLERHARALGLADAVTFVGHVDPERVIEEMLRSGVFLFLSRKTSERLPNVVKEAMACGCTCIVSDTPGIEELLRDGEEGFVVPADDPAATLARLESVLGGETDVVSIRERAVARIHSDFDVRRVMREYLECWTELRSAERTHAEAG